jgi:hypothetical protein
MVYLVFSFDSSPQKRLLPDSALAEPVLRSPEGKAFLARYPESETYVFQDFNLADCCDVVLAHYYYNETFYIPSMSLDTNVNVSADLSEIAITEMRLLCHIPEGVWTIKGDIAQNLQANKQDCWELGPPPTPSNAELIQRAKETDVAKVYLAQFPDNSITVQLNGTISNMPEVTFTPITSEPIKLVVYFAGLDWEVNAIAVACTHGNQIWYHLADDYDFWTYFQPEEGNCWDYAPPNT